MDDTSPTERGDARAHAAAVSFERVEQRFASGLLARRTVLRQIDLAVAPAAALGIVGPNGSGKSSLLRLAAGVDLPKRGHVRVHGASPRHPRVRGRIGWMPEDATYPPSERALTMLATLAALQLPAGTRAPEARARAADMLERVGLAGRERERLGRFSRGLLRRFALAQALVHEPDVIVLDEPSAGLDVEGLERLDALVAAARARAATLLVASHVAIDLHRHVDELALLVDGGLAARGSTRELLGIEDAAAAGVALEFRGLSLPALDELARQARARGAQVSEPQPGQRALARLLRQHTQPNPDSRGVRP